MMRQGKTDDVSIASQVSRLGVSQAGAPAVPVNREQEQSQPRGARRWVRRSLWGLVLSCLVLAPVGNEWAAAFQVPVSVNVGAYARLDKPAEVAVNFTALLTAFGGAGAFDPNSVRVVEIDISGQLLNEAVPFQFDPDPAFDAATNAAGVLIFLVEGTTAPTTARYFHVDFDVVGSGISPAVVPDQVIVTDDVLDEGQTAIEVATQAGTYFYQKQGAGFSSLVDADDNDWIDHHPSGGSAGNFRGIPNLVYPEGHFHPGATSATTTLVSDGPLKASIHSITTDGLWEGLWEIYPQYAKLTVLQAAHDYWFLYEGTPGGMLEVGSDFVVRSDGTQTPLSDSWTQDLAGDEWVYFSDPAVGVSGRSLFLANHTGDSAVDSYFPLAEEMTVFGFGRTGTTSLLNQVPGEFTIGLMDETAFGSAAPTVLSAYKDLSVVLEITPPSIESVEAFGDPTQVTVNFSKVVDPVTTEAAGNYTISAGVTVSAASLSPDGRTVTLTTSALSEGITYTLTINGVEDLFGNVIALNSQVTFEFMENQLQEGLVAYWPLNDGTGVIAADVTGNGHDGTLVNGPVWTGDPALAFDGVDDYVDVGPLGVTGTAVTLAVRFRAADLANCASRDCRIVSQATGTAEQAHDFMLSPIASGGTTRLRFRLKTNGTTTTLVASSGDIPENAWVHVAAVYDGAAMRLYQDGVEVGSQSKSGNVTDSGAGVWLGGNPPSATVRPWDGQLAEVRVYDRALSTEEVALLVSQSGTPPVTVVVPDVVGLTQSAAEAAIVGAGLSVGVVSTANSATVPVGDVISQAPVAGSSVPNGSAVDLVVSLGPVTTVVVPDVVGLTQTAAEAAIVTAGLSVGTVSTANSATVPMGTVISQAPLAGIVVSSGTAVDLVVSLGPVTTVAVPDVVGLAQSAAETALVGAGLSVGVVSTATSATVPAGAVISQAPVAGTVVPSGSAMDLVVSLGPVGTSSRVTDGQVVVYGFQEGAGLTVGDVSGVGVPLDLTITDGAGISWLPGGGLALNTPTLLTSGGAATKVSAAVQVSGEIAIEAWVTPANASQDGPARIVTLSQDATNRNFTLGQGLFGGQPSDLYDVRLRTTTTTANGTPSLSAPAGTLTPMLTHVVYTRDTSGAGTLYVDGVERSSRTDGGDMSNWDLGYALALGDEVSGGRPWLGEYHLVAIFDRALSLAEVQQNFAAGSGVAPQPPSIVTQPVAQTVSEGQTATFSVTATGTAPLGYQWQRDGVDILGAQGASYTTPAVTVAADNGAEFQCMVSDAVGTTTSAAAVLSVLPPQLPLIVTQPVAQTVSEGQTATFSVTATGTGPLGYQWQQNGVDIPGAQGASYTTPAATLADDGTGFQCVVSDDVGTTTSAAAVLSVLPPQPPSIVTQPVAQTVSEGQTATFSVTATGTAPLGYQWQRDGVDILGARGASYTTPAVTVAADNGAEFQCMVSDAVGTTTSAAAVLTVLETLTRMLDDLEALYLFTAGSGDTVFDVAGVGTPLNLNIPDPAAVSWLPGGGLVLNSATQIASVDPATEVSNTIAASGEVALEAWIKPANLTQNGPARIVTLSESPFLRNVTLGQGVPSGSAERYDVRLRTTGTSDNGQPSLSTAVGSLTTELTHVVYTRDVCGTTRIYLDGVLAATGVASGDLLNWNTSVKLALGEEFGSSTRSWLGEYHSVALYSRALSESEVAQNFAAGLAGLSPPPTLGERPMASFTANPTTGNVPLSVNFDAGTSFDPDGTIVSYSWQFGDGQTATGVTASHTYLDSDCLIARLKVTDDQGLVRSASVPITPGSSLTPGSLSWQSLSSAAGDLPVPGSNPEQTAAVVFDINNDGINDFVIGTRLGSGASVVWYEWTSSGWVLHTIDSENLPIEAGGAYYDIDGDGDDDLVIGADSSGTELWWWENPNPNFENDWIRRRIKIGGGNQHHDQIFGDFDGDGATELVYWNNKVDKLFFAEVPVDPTVEPWPATQIFAANSSSPQSEGLAKSDIDGDGVDDIVGAGYWFKHVGGEFFEGNPIDPAMTFTRVVVGQLIAGGRPEVVFDSGDGIGPLRLYEWNGVAWVGSDLLAMPSRFGHSLNIGDIDNDGHLDIFSAEMILQGNSDAKMRLLFGDGTGNFELVEFATGIANHESKLADLDGDGDLDILGKPFREGAPGINIWLNEGRNAFAFWQRQAVDDSVPWRTIFIEHGDIDGDGLEDVITGGWWWKNPGQISGSWTRNTIGAPLNQMAAVYDFDDDGDLDILGTEATGSQANANFRWAENDGNGNFTVHANVESANGTFLQGVTVAEFEPGKIEVALSWQNGNGGFQLLTVPPVGLETTANWIWTAPGLPVEGESLDHGDIDGDGDLDVLMGTSWLRNDGNGQWTAIQLFNPINKEADRNLLVDMDGDGDLDAVIGYGHDTAGTLAWYEQPTDPEALWIEHLIANLGPAQPQSVDVADIDNDGDFDIVAGEHTNPDIGGLRMLVFENTGSDTWAVYEVYAGDEHHDGAQLVDLDQDGDLDIISIGWLHRKLLIYENLQDSAAGSGVTVVVPDVVGLAQSAAEAAIVGAGLSVGTVSTANSATVPAGDVISQVPGAGGSVPTGSAVDLVVSLGTLVTVAAPDVVGLAQSAAEAAIVGAGLSVGTVSTANSATVSAGDVISQVPGAGTVVPSGSAVDLVVSLGPGTTVAVPDVVGLGQSAAGVAIVAAGLSGGTVSTANSATVPAGDVISQAPVGGTVAPSGTAVDLVVSLGPVGTSSRAIDGQVILYGFQEGTGLTVRDVSGVGVPMDLTITDGAGISWLPTGGLALNTPTLLTSGGAATKVSDAVQVSGEIAIEAWVTPANTSQDGPARIVTLSGDASNRNFMLGQGLWGAQPSDLYDVRLRTTATSLNGTPSLSTPAGTLTPALTHVVYTRDIFGVGKLYVDGVERASRTDGGDMSNWDFGYALALGDEVSGGRPWLGEYHLVAIFDRALSPAEVQQNFAAGPHLGAFISDDFNRCVLNPVLWTFVNPFGAGSYAISGAGSGEASLQLSVPAGVEHTPSGAGGANETLRVMQPTVDGDFEMEVKFQSVPSSDVHTEGIVVEQDAQTWLRFDVSYNAGQLNAFAGSTIGGSTSTYFDVAVSMGPAVYLRVSRVADQWTFWYSVDGTSWSELGQAIQPLTMNQVGVFAANPSVASAFTAEVDYFFNTAIPVLPEDGDQNTLTINISGQGTVSKVPDLPFYLCGDMVELTATPDQDWVFGAWSGDLIGNTNPVTLSMDGDKVVEAAFGTLDGPTISVWYGLDQTFGLYGQPQRWVNILGNVTDPDGVSSLTYSLNGSFPPVTLRLGPDGRRLVSSGDFNADLDITDLLSGLNTLVLTATDGFGNVSIETVSIDYFADTVWPQPYAIDWSTLTTPEEIQDVAQVVDGKWQLENGNVRTEEPGYDRLIAVGDMLWSDYTVTVPFTLHSKPGTYGVGVLVRWNGHTDNPVVTSNPKSGYMPFGAILWYWSGRLELWGNNGQVLGTQNRTLSIGTTYWLKARVETVPGVGGLYSLKVWADGQPEPANWDVTGQEQLTDPQSGSMMLITHIADASFGNVTITSNDPP